MNWTARNSPVAKGAEEEAQRHAEQRVGDRQRD
jgi:hypothetical protein